MSDNKRKKAILKKIRRSINAKNFGDAILRCQFLLKDDPQNHMAYLLLGAAYQDNDKVESAKSLRKAIQYSPGTLKVAWKGLALCASTEELPEVYEKLIEYFPEQENEYLEMLMSLADNEQITGECFRVIEKLVKKQLSENNTNALESLSKLWYSHDLNVAVDEVELYKSAMELFVSGANTSKKIGILYNYLKQLFENKNYAECLKHVNKMILFQPKDVYAYELICRIYCDNQHNTESNDWRKMLPNPIETYAEQLIQLHEKSRLARLTKAYQLYENQEFVLARNLLYQVRQLSPNNTMAIELLARTEMHFGAYRLALFMWELLETRNQEKYAQCLSHESDSEQLRKASEILEKCPQNVENIKALARCYLKLCDRDHLAALILDNVTKAEFFMAPSEGLAYIDTIPESETFEAWLLRGKLNLYLENFNEALKNIFKAIRLKPYFAECFDHLGLIYMKANDMVRARKCFEKCINLNMICRNSVYNLNAIYHRSGEVEQNEALLLNFLPYVRIDEDLVLHYRLGLHYLNVKKWDKSIQYFRICIKHYTNCSKFWESLGDAYVGRGSYHSAIRVFKKVLEMFPENIYAQVQIAFIKTTIRMYPEAIEDFEAFLSEHPNNLLALKGAAEAHLALALNYKAKNLFGRAKDHIQKAINHLQSIFLNGLVKEMVWLWRLTAHIFVQTAQLPTSIANLDVSGKLAKCVEVACLTRNDLLHLAVRFYTCALTIKESTYLWYELAHCCYHSAVYLPEEARMHLEIAGRAIKMAIKQQSNRWQNWNLMGIINMHKLIDNLPLAQHCFIRALDIERKSFIAWTNLGALYLQLNEIKLANMAFQRAQHSNPIYANAWIGQAMIAEAMNENEKAMDLFRHSQQFGYHPESALGYAYWICKMMSSPELSALPQNKYAIERMHADTVALDAINSYMRNEELEATIPALTFQAFLQTHKKLYRSALKPLLQAIKISLPGADRDKLSTNLGYLYLQLKEPLEAINAFNTVSDVTFKINIGKALAYCRSSQLYESYLIYKSLLTNFTEFDNNNLADVHVATVAMVYQHQSINNTKIILYQCLLLRDTPVQALYSACAFGILHEDQELTTTVLCQLKLYARDDKYCEDISFLFSRYFMGVYAPFKAMSYLCARIHMFPFCPGIRKLNSLLLMENFHYDPLYHQSLAIGMALCALSVFQQNITIKTDTMEYVDILKVAACAFYTVNNNSGRKYIQRAMHLHPLDRQFWSELF